MERVFLSNLKPLFDAIAEEMTLYVPTKLGEYYSFSRYDPADATEPVFNNIRVSAPVKEFLFPMREMAAVYGGGALAEPQIEPFAVFGLKNCDLRGIKILDCVFKEDEFLDPSYVARRDKMFVIAGDCFDPAETCFCNMVGGQPFAEEGFDLNLSKVKEGFILEAGSEKGERFVKNNERLFSELPSDAMSERDENREQAVKQLDEINAEYLLNTPIQDMVEGCYDSDVFDEEAAGECVECQACTRVCPTCHCFYLYDAKQKAYFEKMKMWDSCMRCDYTTVAGGANPRKMLGDRLRHRLMHKFVYFLERYGIEMCVGCGRCIEGCAGGTKLRKVLSSRGLTKS